MAGTYKAENGFTFKIYDIAEAIKKPERKPIVKNYFYDRTISLIYGQAGTYKTWWSLFEAVSLVLGKQILDMDIEPDPDDLPHDVLYITLEMTAKDISDRASQICKNLTPEEKRKVNDHFRILSYEDTIGISATSRGFLDALGELSEKPGFNFDIVYIDSFSDYVAGFDLRSEDHMRRVINDLRRLTVDYHLNFRIIHHGTKTFSDGSGGSMAGIHTIRDLVDSVLSMKQTAKDEIKITSDQLEDPSAKTRYGKPKTLYIGVETDQETYFNFYPKAENEKSGNLVQMSRILTEIMNNQGITAGELKENLGRIDYKLRDSMIGNSLVMTTEKNGRGKDTKHFYTIEYYNDHREEIDGQKLNENHNGDNGAITGKNGAIPV